MLAALFIVLAAFAAGALLRNAEERALRGDAHAVFFADELCVGWPMAPGEPVGLVCAGDTTRIPAVLARSFGRPEGCDRLDITGEILSGQSLVLTRLESGACALSPGGWLPGSLRLMAHGKIRPSSDGAEDLRALPTIGQVRAETIVEERRLGGPFKDGEDLRKRVRGIGPKTLERIAPLIDFEDAKMPSR